MNDSSMYVVVYANEGMDQGYVYLARKLDDEETLNARAFAEQVARTYDRDLAPSSGYIQNCFGDLRVEFLSHPPNIEHDARNECDRYLGSTCIWSGESFYFAREDY